ncbi:MAG: DUF3999 domain-containing protein [Burkholderiales bacterium]|nr:DUF3999 domain-containing protein [Burkholderiales bacterium]
MKTMLFGLTAGCLLLAAAESVAQPVESFTHVMTVKQQGGDGLQRVLLPAAVHQGSARDDLGDLRVFNARGEQVPFAHAAAPRVAETAPTTHGLPIFPLTVARTGGAADDTLSLQIRQQKDGTLISLNSRTTDGKSTALSAEERRDLSGYIVDASHLNPGDGKAEPVRVSALVFDWEVIVDSRAGRVRIETSNDLKAWSTLIQDGALVDLEHAGQRLTQKRIDVTPTDARYLRLTWADKPFVLKSVTAEMQAERAAPALSRHVVSPEAGKVDGLQAGEHVFDLGGRLPVREVRLLLPEPNTVAPVRIFARRDVSQPWRQVESATFYRLNRDGVELVSPAVKLPPQNERFWKVAVDARAGGLGQGRPQLEVGWQPQSIVFAARGEGPYRLAWGNAEAAPAQLSLTALVPGYRQDSEYSLPVAEAGDVARQTVTPPSALAKLTQTFTLKQGVLWLVLLLGVGLLGLMAWRLNAQMTTPTPPPQAGVKDAS